MQLHTVWSLNFMIKFSVDCDEVKEKFKCFCHHKSFLTVALSTDLALQS